MIPIERSKMRLRISFENQEQEEKMKEFLEKEHSKEFEIEKITEKMM